MRNRVTRRWPTVAEVIALFPHLDARRAAKTALHIGALYERNRVLVRCVVRHGIDPLRSMVTAAESFRSIRGPRIFATFHVGAIHAFGPALERLESPVIAFRSGSIFTPGGALVIESTKGDEQARAGALHRALLHLRNGGVVLLALDDAPGEAIETRCLGRRLCMAPGAFALARWTGTAIQPVAARWIGSRIAIESYDPVNTPDEAAQWLERYLLENPSEITLGLLRSLLGVS
ncbi:MAG TPA: hypothetical protein VGQ36_04205 [Thermoanaerobaculia bacterium]|nr:hypothetical protein [Thermoanaerobaculia bacterium]